MHMKTFTFLAFFSLFKKTVYLLPFFRSKFLAAALVLGLSATASLNVVAQTVSAQPLTTQQSRSPTTVLSIVQVCTKMARGGGCKLLFVPTQNELTSAGDIHSTCAPGWLAYLSVEQGTVEQGGVNRGEAVVCGHTNAASALKAVVRACNEQNFGMCSQASHIDTQWAFMPEKNNVLVTLPLNQAVDLRSFEQYQTCQSTVPVSVSATCSTQAAEAARLAGFQ
jgi:hypothetical protein